MEHSIHARSPPLPSHHRDADDEDTEIHSTHHCHQCHCYVRPSPTVSPLACPLCNGEFLEQASDVTPPSSPDQIHGYMGGFGHLLDEISTFLATRDVCTTVNPFLILHDHVQTNLLHVSDDDGGYSDGDDDDDDGSTDEHGHGFSIVNTLDSGLVHIGQRRVNFSHAIRHLLQQVAQQHDANSSCNVSPPASASSVDRLPTMVYSNTDKNDKLNSSLTQCPICKDEFQPNSEIKQMPCRHLYHSDCLLPWLAQHNSCPVCRFELPTDDPEYEQVHIRTVSARSSHEGIHKSEEGSSSTQGLF